MRELRANLQVISYINKDLEVETAQAVNIDIKDISIAVTQNPSQELKNDILTNGMLYPIIVTGNSKEEYEFATYGLSNANAYDPSKPYLAIIGNQRLAIAKEHFSTIDAFIIEKGIDSIFIKLAYEEQNGRI